MKHHGVDKTRNETGWNETKRNEMARVRSGANVKTFDICI